MKLTKRQLKQIIREEHRRLQESGHRPYDPYKAEIYYGGLEELVYKEIGIVDSVRGAANRSPLAGKFYSTMVAIAEAKGDRLMVELLKAAYDSAMKSKYMEDPN